jgi:hypothetical protein
MLDQGFQDRFFYFTPGVDWGHEVREYTGKFLVTHVEPSFPIFQNPFKLCIPPGFEVSKEKLGMFFV